MIPAARCRIADDGEILLTGPNIFQGYYKNQEATDEDDRLDGWMHTGDLGSIDEDGFLSITGRKKDIIITAGGKNLTPANIENDIKQNRWISQAVMLRRPAALPGRADHPRPRGGARAGRRSSGSTTPTWRTVEDPEVRERIQAILDEVNANYAQVEQVKKFTILDHDLSQDEGELTPTMKVKRNVVYEKYADRFEKLYAG